MTLLNRRGFATSLLVVTLAAGLFASCAPRDQKISDRARPGAPAVVEGMSFDSRALQVSAHLLVQLTDMRRLLDQSLRSAPAATATTGCRTVSQTTNEGPVTTASNLNTRYQVKYNRCADVADRLSRVDLSGAESFAVGYSTAPIAPGAFPHSVAVSISSFYDGHPRVDVYSDKDSVRVNRTGAFAAQLVSEDAATLTYALNFSSTDVFEFDVQLAYRQGTLNTTLNAVAVVDRATRAVTLFQPSLMTAGVRGKQYNKSDVRGTSISNRRSIDLKDFSVVARGDLRFANDPCSLVEGDLTVRRGSKDVQESPMTSAGGRVAVEGAGETTLRLCAPEREADPVFAQDFEALYF